MAAEGVKKTECYPEKIREDQKEAACEGIVNTGTSGRKQKECPFATISDLEFSGPPLVDDELERLHIVDDPAHRNPPLTCDTEGCRRCMNLILADSKTYPEQFKKPNAMDAIQYCSNIAK